MSYFYPPPTRQEARPFTVSEINRQVRMMMEHGFSHIAVEAEVVSLTRAASGHIYFNLADPGGSAQLNAVMWRTTAYRYGKRIVKGAKLRAIGRLTVYEARGTYQMVVDQVTDSGAGSKARELAELKKQLAREGLFDAERKRPLPLFPKTIGIVTSRSGAAIQDIVKVIRRRFPVNLLLAHAQVQGERAPIQIIQGLNKLQRRADIDVIIIGRGGGSSEDLDAFNAEMVVRAVATFPVPVISAVGHEIDTSLVDLAADRRAATPSEAAELAVPDCRAVEERFAQSSDGLHQGMMRMLERADAALVSSDRRLRIHDPRMRLKNGMAQLARAEAALARWPQLFMEKRLTLLHRHESALSHWPTPTLQLSERRIAILTDRLMTWPKQAMPQKRHQLSLLTRNLDAISPLSSLARGYSVVRRSNDGAILRNATDVSVGDNIEITLHEGSLACSVNQQIPKKD